MTNFLHAKIFLRFATVLSVAALTASIAFHRPFPRSAVSHMTAQAQSCPGSKLPPRQRIRE